MTTPIRDALSLILFDVGGVLSPDNVEEKVADLARVHGLAEAELLAHGLALRAAADLGELDEVEYWRALLEQHGVTPRPEDLAFQPYLRVDREAVAFVHALAARVRVGILSNDTRQMAAARRRMYDPDAALSPVVISAEVGLVKPEPAIYRYAVAAAECPADRALFIDDRLVNVQGALAAGLHSMRFRGVTELRRRLIAEFDLTVED